MGGLWHKSHARKFLLSAFMSYFSQLKLSQFDALNVCFIIFALNITCCRYELNKTFNKDNDQYWEEIAKSNDGEMRAVGNIDEGECEGSDFCNVNIGFRGTESVYCFTIHFERIDINFYT